MKTGEINYIDEVKKDRAMLNSDDYEYSIRVGRGRYNKVVANYKLQNSLSAVAFIDKTTGFMYRAASWSQPAKTRIV